MPSNESLKEFYDAHLQAYALGGPQSFLVFPIASAPVLPVLPYNRRDFYQISLYTGGATELRYAGHTLPVESPALLLNSPLAPYACHQLTPLQGYSCLFTADFLAGPAPLALWQETPLFQLGTVPVYPLNAEQLALFATLFRQLHTKADSTYRHRLDLLRTYLQLLLHEVLQLQPPPPLVGPTAARRLTAAFLQLLEQQFPVASPTRPLVLHTAEAMAGQLGVHVNYLSRVLREVTGKPTSAHLAARIVQEARMLLRHSDWPIADIAEALGFTDPTYFHHFFRKHVGTAPATFRQQATTGPATELNVV
jgi:AraC family transcriptional activator of pobA